MSTIAIDLPTNYATEENTIASWLLTRDHKRIALLFLGSITFFFFIGGFAATLMRLNLATPGGLLQPSVYNRMFTMHGVVMVWFFLIPSIPTTLGNFFIPMAIGAHDLAFPRVNLGSWYVFNLSGLVLLYALVMGGVDTGWTFYTPYSTLYANGYVFAAAMAVFINGFSSIMTASEFCCDHPSLACAGNDLDPPAAFCLGHLFRKYRHADCHAGIGDGYSASRGRALYRASDCSIRSAAAIRCCGSTCSGSIRTRPSTL